MRIGGKVRVGSQEVYQFNQGFRKAIYFSFFGLLALFVTLFLMGAPFIYRLVVSIPYAVLFILILIDIINNHKYHESRMKQLLKWDS